MAEGDDPLRYVFKRYQRLSEFKGVATIRHVRRLIRLLRKEVDTNYSAAGTLTRMPGARYGQLRTPEHFAEYLEDAGFGRGDTFGRRVRAVLAKWPSSRLGDSPDEYRKYADALAEATDDEVFYLYDYFKILKEARTVDRGRLPSAAMFYLLRVAHLHIGDAELARRLAAADIMPEGPSDPLDEADVVEQWRIVIKAWRARWRQRQRRRRRPRVTK